VPLAVLSIGVPAGGAAYARGSHERDPGEQRER
jgi:hypothetical protein